MGKNGGQGLGNIGARLEGLLKQKLASIFSYCSYQIIGQNKIKTGQTGTRHIKSYAVGMGVILRVHLLTLSRLCSKYVGHSKGRKSHSSQHSL